MSRATPLALFAGLLLLPGCQGPAPGETEAARPRLNKQRSVEITPADEEFAQQRAAADSGDKKTRPKREATELAEGELYRLPKMTVSQTGLRKLGLSVVTNTEVAAGGAIEWMRIGVVLRDSPAARAGLFTGVEILAINNVPIAHLTREQMLHLLFEREAGQPVRLLVTSRYFGALPRFVTL